MENDTDVARARETVVETWDDWRLDQEWDDDDDATTTTTSFESQSVRMMMMILFFPNTKKNTYDKNEEEEATADDDDDNNKYLGYATKEDRCLIDFWRGTSHRSKISTCRR